jgi:hypothetical protein
MGGVLSKRKGSDRNGGKGKPKITIVDKRRSTVPSKETVDRAREIGMILDPAVETTPEQMRVLTEQAVQFNLLEPIVVLDKKYQFESYGPTSDFVEAFMDIRRQMLERAKGPEEQGDATYGALARTVSAILDIVKPENDEGQALADKMNFTFLMGMHMSQPHVCGKLGIDGLDFLPGVIRDKMKKRMTGQGTG